MALNDFLRPLTEDDPRRLESFDCGEPQMNAFIRRRAWEQQRNLINRTFLVLGDQPDVCPGFITLSAAHIETDLTGLSRRAAVYTTAPATLIGRLATHVEFQRQGLARALLAAARVIGQTLPIGCRFLVLHVEAANRAAISLYDSEGFRVPEGYEPEDGLLLMFYDLATRRPAGQAGLAFTGF